MAFLTDDTGRHTPSTIGGGPSSDQTEVKFGTSSAEFNGSSQAVEVASDSDFNPNGTDYTVHGWFKASTQAYPAGMFFATDWLRISLVNNGKVRFDWLTQGQHRYDCDSSSDDNQWHHFAFCLEENGTGNDYAARSYVDGYCYYAAQQNDRGMSTGNIYIGRNNSSSPSWQWLNGNLDAIELKKGVAAFGGSAGQQVFDPGTFNQPTADGVSDVLLLNFNLTIYEISGNLSHESRLIVIDEATGTVEHDQVEPAGAYSMTPQTGDNKMVIARRESDGEVLGYGDVTPVTL